ncbi:MAG: SpoIID/LytB domain-containing protein [Thermoleophilaceae bacterium]|nr:SpoIID/LytB domain-containing protein [Thermoleophilaceae bacterium]
MRRTLAVTAFLVVFAVAATAADAAVRHVIRGAGFGHGIGMSQYGAYGYALKGRAFDEILAHYYKGTRLASAPTRPVRVLLQPEDPYIRVRGATRIAGRSLKPGRTYVARESGGAILVTTSSGRRVARVGNGARFEGPEPLRLLGPALNFVTSGVYRGAIEVRTEGSGVTAINVLDLDTYVRGVVAGEMPSSWPLEALKTQAVAARTYALSTRKTTGLFDQYPDTRSQVYRGVTGESVRSDAAVRDTAGRIVTYGGVPAVTYYFSTSGGHTENVEFSFVGSLSKPWLVGVPDPYDTQSPYHRWELKTTAAALDRALGAPGTFESVKVLDRGVSPRVVRARVIGSKGSTVLTGPTIRSRLGLRDTWFTFVRIASSARYPRSARPASWGARLTAAALAGEFSPAPKRRVLVLERRAGSDWRAVRRIRTTASGRYRVEIGRAGAYRVRTGRVAGPAVRVR